MWKSLPFVFSAVVLCLVTNVLAQHEVYLPHVANGQFTRAESTCTIRTTFVLFNPTDQIVAVNLRLTDDLGDPWRVGISGLGTSDQFALTLQPGQSLLLQTDGGSSLRTGAARVQSNGPVGASAIYSLYTVSWSISTEAGVPSSPPLTGFVVPVDSTGSFDTGIALFNFNNTDATVTYTLVDEDGMQTATTGNPKTETLAAGAHMAKFFSGADGLFPAVGDHRGTMLITSNIPIAGIVLRQYEEAIPHYLRLKYTTLPVVSRAETRTSFNLTQVANGLDAPTRLTMRTTFIAFNISATPATVNFTVRKPNGAPFPVTIPGVVGNSANFAVNIPPGGSVFLQTDGSGDLSAGSAEVASNTPVGVAAVFTLFGPSMDFRTEAGVGNSPVLNSHTIPVEVGPPVDTGVAFFNPNSTPVVVNISLLDTAGVKVADAGPVTLPPKNQQPRLVPELFPGFDNVKGSMAINATAGGVATLTLRMTRSPLTYATLPIAEGLSQGSARPALLDENRTNIDATQSGTLDVQLAAGFKLSGTVSGAAQMVRSVVARSATGQEFAGVVNTTNGKYLVVVPAGAYTLRFCYTPQTDSSGNIPSISFGDPDPVQVDADTTRDVVIPARGLYAVSGTVAGIAELPANDGILLNLVTVDGTSGGNAAAGADGAYQIQLPDGAYTASLVVSLLQAPPPNYPQTLLALYNIGSVVVNNAPATANFTLPARATVSGLVGFSKMLPGSCPVTATDTSAPAIAASFCSFPPTSSSTIAVTSGPGATPEFRMTLGTGRSYRLTVSVGASAGGVATIPTNGLLIGPVTQDMTAEGLGVPYLPGDNTPMAPPAITISGKVTDPQGQGVPYVSVVASSSQITSAGRVSYTNSTVTGSVGNYGLTVLPGTAYQFLFAPLKPQP